MQKLSNSDWEIFNQRLADFAQDLLSIPEQRERLRYLIERGEELPELSVEMRTEQNKVAGCVATVYVCGQLENGKLSFCGDADALIVKGYLTVLFELFAGLEPQVLLESQTEIAGMISRTGLNQSLVASRANSFGNIFRKMLEQTQSLIS